MRYLSDVELEGQAAHLFENYGEGWAGDMPLTDLLIAQTEGTGCKLPADYVALTCLCNGGLLVRNISRYLETDRSGKEYACELLVRSINGIGWGNNPNALCGARGSRFWEAPANWNYPHIGIYFAKEGGSHGLFALDCRCCGPRGESTVVNMYHNGSIITHLADNFADFVRKLHEG